MKKLRELRELKKITQTQMAILCGVSLTTYQLWERGVTTPKPENLKKLEQIVYSD
jgi:transcriptional regulator with XRE-family HTH domain